MAMSTRLICKKYHDIILGKFKYDTLIDFFIMESWMNKNNASFPLIYANEADSVTIGEICGGQHFKEKCINMGIIPGQKIEVINNSGNGPCIVKVNNARLMIGHGMLNRILVCRE